MSSPETPQDAEDVSKPEDLSEAEDATDSDLRQPPILDDALLYLDKVQAHFPEEPERYNRFLDIMKGFKTGLFDTPGVILLITTLFNGNPDLIDGFNTFLPEGYLIEIENYSKKIFSREEIWDRSNYLDELLRFHSARGPISLPIGKPLDGHQLDFYDLKKKVDERGGFELVRKTHQWVAIGHELGYKDGLTYNLPESLEQFYVDYIAPYEIQRLTQPDNQLMTEPLTTLAVRPDERQDEWTLPERPESKISSHQDAAAPSMAPFTDSGYGSITREKYAVAGDLASLNESMTLNQVWSNDSHSAETESVYSAASTLPDFLRDGYVVALAEDITKFLAPYLVDKNAVERLYESLPRSLEALSLSLGTGQLSQIHRNVTFFIRKYRRNIASSCRDLALERSSLLEGRDNSEMMSLEEKMKRWQDNTEAIEALCELMLESHSDEDAGDDNFEDSDDSLDADLPDIQAYRQVVQSTPAYSKLLSDLRRECTLSPSEPNVIEEIRRSIRKILPISSKISRRAQPERFQMVVSVDWTPLLFIQQQEYQESPGAAMKHAIVFTGSLMATQAMTCIEYLEQTWPSIGVKILELLQGTISGEPSSVVLPDDTQVDAFTQMQLKDNGRCLRVVIKGLSTWIVEITEILAWIATALQSSPLEDKLACTRPFITSEKLKSSDSSRHTCKISFNTRLELGERITTNGRCWNRLFKNPVVVEGYPISRRPSECPGLEIPLALMAGLSQTGRVQPYGDRLFIKGFSTILVPTDRHNNIIMWHLLIARNGDRISYNEGAKLSNIPLKISDLQASRHILGWCSNIKFYAGADGACYNVKNSRLPRASEGSLLSNTSVSMGQVVTGGAPFAIGLKDMSPHITRDGYVRKLKWIAKKFVLLWDEADKRGWLVNGTSALLHLVRTSLEYDRTSEFSSAIAFNPASLDSPSPHQSHSAARILVSQRNRELEIYDGEEKPIRFQDHVTNFYDLMEKILDHQSAAMEGGDRNSRMPRSQLEGWDFNDLASGRDPVHTRATKLDATGMSWVDLTRAVHAVSLFGRGFGDLITPMNPCPRWTMLPTGQSYLAVCYRDLQEIVDTCCGDLSSSPMRLTDQLIWSVSQGHLVECHCHSRGENNGHSDIAQVLLPSSMASRLPPQGGIAGHNEGAIIFGYNATDPWYWPDMGEPSRQPIEETLEQGKSIGSSLSRDSGFGNSLSTPPSVDNDSTVDVIADHCAIEEMTEHVSDVRKPTASPPPRSPYSMASSYTVGIICALHKELMAVRMLFDSVHRNVAIPANDPNSYAFGCLHKHNVVAACLPDGEYGTNPAADVASNMKRTFSRIQFCLLVGIGGGVPSDQNDIRLGDVVVSKPSGTSVGVLPYDMKKTLEKGRFHLNGYLQPPPRSLRSVLSEMQSDPTLSNAPLSSYLHEIEALDADYGFPGPENDILYASDYPHPDDNLTCDECEASRVRVRVPRGSNQPLIHYGTIASGNQVMKDAETRDELGKEYNVLCFEMEAAGIMNIFPSLIIRGICDYCDSHKNKDWQKYATATAAAFAKLLLSRVRPGISCGDNVDYYEDGGPAPKRRRMDDPAPL